jgi:Flp pilus assembly protein TadG
MRILREETGQTLVLTALCGTVLIGFMGLVFDVGVLFRARRDVQTAADAAAVAAAMDYYYNYSVLGSTYALTHAQAAGKAAALLNGIPNSSVTVNCSPTSGPSVNASKCNGFFEAVVIQPSHTVFMSTFSQMRNANNYSSINVAARAVAGTPVTNDHCIWITDQSGGGTDSDVLHIQGNSTINAPGCGIYVNSSDSAAIKVTGNSNNYNGPEFDVVGGYSGHQVSPTPITTNVPVSSPPIPTDLTGPLPNGGTDANGNSVSPACTGSNTLTANTVTSANLPTALNGVVCFNPSSGTTTLSGGLNLPGSDTGVVYVFEKGVSIGTGSAVTMGSASYSSISGFSNTKGAVMDIYGGTLDQASNNLLNIYAPTTGTYNSLAIMQPYTNTSTLQVQFGSNNQTLDGIIYAPGGLVYLQDNGGGVTASGVIANKMFIKSSTFTIPGYSASNLPTTPFKIVTLTE